MINAMHLTLDLNRNKIPADITPLDYLKQTFLDAHGFELVILKDKYSIARKELYVVVDISQLPSVQEVYDNTEYPLIKHIEEYIDNDCDIGPWEVMQVFLSKTSINQWKPLLAGAYLYALFKDLSYINDPRIAFEMLESI